MPLQIKPMLSANRNTFPVKQLSIKGIAMAMRIAGHSSVMIGDWLGEKLPVSFIVIQEVSILFVPRLPQ